MILEKRDCIVNWNKDRRTWRYLWHILIWLYGATSSSCFLYVLRLNVNNVVQARDTVKKMLAFREKLPANKIKYEFLKAVAANQVGSWNSWNCFSLTICSSECFWLIANLLLRLKFLACETHFGVFHSALCSVYYNPLFLKFRTYISPIWCTRLKNDDEVSSCIDLVLLKTTFGNLSDGVIYIFFFDSIEKSK